MSAATDPNSAAQKRWSNPLLDEARQQGDSLADALAAKIFSTSSGLAPTDSRLGYNGLIDLADVLSGDAELLLIKDSNLARRLAQYPQELQDFFEPTPAPDWVDPDKLELATELWTQNSLAMIAVLYAASLPACYLIRNGIPALYQTEKLRDKKYIFQRIYETGVMLDAVMSPGGLELIRDVVTDPDELMRESLNSLDPSGTWEKVGRQLVRHPRAGVAAAAATSECTAPSPDDLQDRFDDLEQKSGGRTYVWGPGFIAARKVRMLHASMRFMLLHPEAMSGARPSGTPQTLSDALRQQYSVRKWPTAERGVPVNQEDLAYTLLTFSYLLPRGLEIWGCRVTLEQKEAFLHLWKVIGHIMGIREDLMTDRWDEAQALFERIAERQVGPSEAGVALTDAVAWFLASYLPEWGVMRHYLPYTLIADQLGMERAQMLLGPAEQDRLQSSPGQIILKVVHQTVVLYYGFYQNLLDRLPLLRPLFGDLFHKTSDELISSWRDEYNRRPFYVPKDLTTWERRRGVDEQYMAALKQWRGQIFLGVVWPVVLIGLTFLTIIATVILLLLHRWLGAWITGGLTLVLMYSALWRMQVSLPRLYARRPEPRSVVA